MSKLQVTCESNACIASHLAHLLKNSTFSGQHNFKFALKKAIKSVRSFPFPIETESEALNLEGVGPALAREIMKARSKNAEKSIAESAVQRLIPDAPPRNDQGESIKYHPCEGKGPWAVLWTLHHLQGAADKSTILQSIATHLSCDMNSAAVWSRSMKTLKEKGLVVEAGAPGYCKQYVLTKPAGEQMAATVCRESKGVGTAAGDLCGDDSEQTSTASVGFRSSYIANTDSSLSESKREVVVLSDSDAGDSEWEAREEASGCGRYDACWDFTQEEDEEESTSMVVVTESTMSRTSTIELMIPPSGAASDAVSLRERLALKRARGTDSCSLLFSSGNTCSETTTITSGKYMDISVGSSSSVVRSGVGGNGVVDLISSDSDSDSDSEDKSSEDYHLENLVNVEPPPVTRPRPSSSLPAPPSSSSSSSSLHTYADGRGSVAAAPKKQRTARDAVASSSSVCPRDTGVARSASQPVLGSVTTTSRNTQTFLLSQPSSSASSAQGSSSWRGPGTTSNGVALSSTASLSSGASAPLSGQWEVVLLIDKREKEFSFFESFMLNHGVRAEVGSAAPTDCLILPCVIICVCCVCVQVCQLALGDYMWVAKPVSSGGMFSGENIYDDADGEDGYCSSASSRSSTHTSPMRPMQRKRKGSVKQQRQDAQSNIRVLDCIVERKTVVDLASSIVDGRYDEQKQRLCNCGVAHVVYLVEGISLNPQGVGGGGRGRGRTGVAGRGAGAGAAPSQERSGSRGAGVNSAAILTALAATQVTDITTRPSVHPGAVSSHLS
jgi:ERCC4-type nuclease